MGRVVDIFFVFDSPIFCHMPWNFLKQFVFCKYFTDLNWKKFKVIFYLFLNVVELANVVSKSFCKVTDATFCNNKPTATSYTTHPLLLKIQL